MATQNDGQQGQGDQNGEAHDGSDQNDSESDEEELPELPRFEMASRPDFPPRPDLLEKVAWPSSPPDDKDILKAFRLWNRLDQNLEDQLLYYVNTTKTYTRPTPDPSDKSSRASSCLSLNVYNHLLMQMETPITDDAKNPEHGDGDEEQLRTIGDPDAQLYINPANHGALVEWNHSDFLDAETDRPFPPVLYLRDIDNDSEIRLEVEWADQREYTKAILIHWHNLLLQTPPPRDFNREDIHTNVVDAVRLMWDNSDSRIEQTHVKVWGVTRDKHVLQLGIGKKAPISPLNVYTWALTLSPYNPAYWNSRAYLYYQLGFLDLALGDAYRALLLCHIIDDEDRAKQPGLYRLVHHAVEKHIMNLKKRELSAQLLQTPGVSAFIPHLRKTIHHIISLSLIGLQCFDYASFNTKSIGNRIVLNDRDFELFETRKTMNKALKSQIKKLENEKVKQAKLLPRLRYETLYGQVSGKDHPQITNQRTQFRPDADFFAKITGDVLGRSQVLGNDTMNDDLFAYCSDLRVGYSTVGTGLGVFVEHPRTIQKDQYFYIEEPSVRGNLKSLEAKVPKNKQSYTCQNCSKHDPDVAQSENANATNNTQNTAATNGQEPPFVVCKCHQGSDPQRQYQWCNHANKAAPKAFEFVVGPDGEVPNSCLEIANAIYHRHSCGKDWRWLHDAMRPMWSEETAAGRFLTHSNDKHGTVLSLMLRDIFDATLIRQEDRGKPYMPHELEELFFLEPRLQARADYSRHRFPFGWSANIVVPFDILLNMGVNIFSRLEFDTWTIQACIRKLIINAIPHKLDSNRNPMTRSRDAADPNIEDGIKPDNDDSVNAQDYLEAPNGHMFFPVNSKRFKPWGESMYLFPGLALFNHACGSSANAVAHFGKSDGPVPNRIWVKATRWIRPEDEILIEYVDTRGTTIDNNLARRIFGRICGCPEVECKRKRELFYDSDGDDDFIDDTTPKKARQGSDAGDGNDDNDGDGGGNGGNDGDDDDDDDDDNGDDGGQDNAQDKTAKDKTTKSKEAAKKTKKKASKSTQKKTTKSKKKKKKAVTKSTATATTTSKKEGLRGAKATKTKK